MNQERRGPRPGPGPYRTIIRMLRALVAVFFRRVEVVGLENLPDEGGGILVSWHPNGLIDPGLVLTSFPGQVVFGARHGLFKWPGLGTLLKQIGTVPIYRQQDMGSADPDARRKANEKSLDALADKVASGRFSALFPEGVSHDAPHLMELKTGAARLYYRARQRQAARGESGPPPVIVPVGLHYDSKDVFRSNALVAFHPPIELPAILDVTPPEDEHEQKSRKRFRALTSKIGGELRDVVHATDDWRIYHLRHRSRALVRAERAWRRGTDPGKQSLQEKTLGFARIRAGYYQRLKEDPDTVLAIRERVEAYDAALRQLGLKDHELDHGGSFVSPWLGLILLLQIVAVFLLAPPLLLMGYLINGPTALGLLALARAASKQKKDEATVKILVGAVVFPLTWIVAGIAGGFGYVALNEAFPALPNTPILCGVSVALMGAIGGAVALRYLRVAGETIHGVQVRITRNRRWFTVARLKKERKALHDIIMTMAKDLELPGEVAPDGTIRDKNEEIVSE